MATYVAVVTYDFRDASSEQYKKMIEELAKHNLVATIPGTDTKSGKQTSLPANTFYGKFSGPDMNAIKDQVVENVKQSGSIAGAKGRFYIVVYQSSLGTWLTDSF